MSAHPPRTRLVPLILAALLILPWSAGALPAPGGALRPAAVPSPGPWPLLSQAWGLLVSLWAEEGCMIDPNGRCASAPAVAPADEGCGIDPDGCRAAATVSPAPLDEGCGIDPSGCR